MFDEMPAQKRGKLDKEAPGEVSGTGGDRVSALPDALLKHVLSFLPAEDVVRTCVLSHRWRHLWKSAPGLRIGCRSGYEYEPLSVTTLRRFVDSLFLLRGVSPLDACELRIGDFNEDGDEERVNLWFRHAVVCKARVLKLYVAENHLLLDNLPLVSKHLSRLELQLVWFHTRILDFSSCPALKHLKFVSCDLQYATKISSESLKCLSIIDSCFSEDQEQCLRIYSPNLTSLHLDDYIGSTPILDSMPLLVEAFVGVGSYGNDWCDKLSFGRQDCDCEYCDSGNVRNGDCLLLKSLAHAKQLTLISVPEMVLLLLTSVPL